MLICGVATAQQSSSNDEAQSLVVVKNAEGKIYKVDDMNSIDKNSINHVTVIKKKDACKEFKKYGDISDGVIYIELKAQPLIVVKGTNGDTYKVDEMKSIDNNSVESIFVIKNNDACEKFKEYGDTSGGVIYIELKK